MGTRGIFVSFEGADGCGKTTAISLFTEELKKLDLKVTLTREPGGVPLGEAIRDVLLHTRSRMNPRTELLLFLASRSQVVDELIRPALDANDVVIADRFLDSSVAYQGYARGLGYDRVRQLCDYATEGLLPDVTYYLDIDLETGLKRRNVDLADRIESEGLKLQAKVIAGYRKLAGLEPERIVTIDGRPDPTTVLTAILADFKLRFPNLIPTHTDRCFA